MRMRFDLKIALHLLSCYQMISSEIDVKKLYGPTGRDAEHLIGRAQMYSYKKSLPPDLTEISKHRAEKVTCGESFALPYDGYVLFKLSSRKPCFLSFSGSHTDRCTAAFYCDGKVNLAPRTDKGCTKDYLVITDGVEGMMTGCGTFSFGRVPLVARNNGSDISVYFKGSSSGNCIVFCIEDLRKPGNNNLKQRKQLNRNKNYQGLHYDASCTCGIRKNFGRIVGGQVAERNEFPWIGALVPKIDRYQRTAFCGGSLINSQYFVTAGHCFAHEGITEDFIQVLLHAHVLDQPDGSKSETPGWNLPVETDQSAKTLRIDVEKITVHPLFNGKTFDFDVAVVKLKTPVDFKKRSDITPICLPNIGEDIYSSIKDGTFLTVSGWGRPSELAKGGSRILEKLDVPYVNLKKCQEYNWATSRHICAGFLEGGKDACSGDSGGPVVYPLDKSKNQYLLPAIVSAGTGCARRSVLGLYSNIQELVQWIYTQTHHDATWCKRK